MSFPLYFDLRQDTKRYVEPAFLADDFLGGVDDDKAFTLAINLRAQAEAALCIVDQTERLVLHGQKVPATAKRVSMFEAHADMLCKRNQICFGHKVCLAFGKTGVVLATDILRAGRPDEQAQLSTIYDRREADDFDRGGAAGSHALGSLSQAQR